jgi:SAM-dependent methyltransferase
MTSSPSSPLDQRYLDTRSAFDSVADQYRGPLGNNPLVQHMREVLWLAVEARAKTGSRLLDLGCGAGLDAVHFAQAGYSVRAIDWSPAMVAQTCREAQLAGVGERLTAETLGIQELERLSGEKFDCIYSDLGALNCVSDLEAVARHCARLLEADGALVFSVIGRYCPWEMAYYGLRGKLGRVRVRFAAGQVPVSLNGRTVWTRYYSPREFYRIFESRFEWQRCRALNLFLPPPYLIGPFERHPSVFRPLAWLDEQLGGLPILNRTGDHFLIVMSRRNGAEATPDARKQAGWGREKPRYSE